MSITFPGESPEYRAARDELTELELQQGAAMHVAQRVNLVAIAKAPARTIPTFARERGWKHLRLLSSQSTSFNRDYHAETEEGWQRPIMHVFHRENDGTVRRFWSSELLYAPADPGQDTRHVGPIEPLWNILDLTPEGRGTDWDEQLSYA